MEMTICRYTRRLCRSKEVRCVFTAPFGGGRHIRLFFFSFHGVGGWFGREKRFACCVG